MASGRRFRMQKLINLFEWVRRQPRWRVIGAVLVLVAVLASFLAVRGKTTSKTPTFAARRGPLEITVLEGGSMQALESQEIKCEVRVGYQGTKILKIVDEGYFVTEEDIRTNKVLCELDGSDLQKQIVQQEIQYQSALAALTDAEQGYEIQLGQNQSDISAAEQKARFARLDFDKMLGDKVTSQIIAQVGLDKLLAAAITNNVEETSRALEAASPPFGSAPAQSGEPQAFVLGDSVKFEPVVMHAPTTNAAVAASASPGATNASEIG